MNSGIVELPTTPVQMQASCPGTRSILIVEDHPMVADAMQETLRKVDVTLRPVVCGSARAALDSFHGPNSWFRILLDIDVPGADGLSLVREFWRLGVAFRCCVITGLEKPEWVTEVRAMGMLGYLYKAAPVGEFTSALESILMGVPVFPASVGINANQSVRLTRRQQDMLCLLHRGYSSKAIASQLGLTEGTVNNHVSGLLRTLGAANRTHAVAKALQLGCIQSSARVV